MPKLLLALLLFRSHARSLSLHRTRTRPSKSPSVKVNTSGDGNGNLRGAAWWPRAGHQHAGAAHHHVCLSARGVSAHRWPQLAEDRRSSDLIAKLEGARTPRTAALPGVDTPNSMQLALRPSARGRFKLKVHRETREMDVYALVMARPGGGPGPGLKPTTQDCADGRGGRRSVRARRSPGSPRCSRSTASSGSPGRVRFGGCRQRRRSRRRSLGRPGRMVVDRTGRDRLVGFRADLCSRESAIRN